MLFDVVSNIFNLLKTDFDPIVTTGGQMMNPQTVSCCIALIAIAL